MEQENSSRVVAERLAEHLLQYRKRKFQYVFGELAKEMQKTIARQMLELPTILILPDLEENIALFVQYAELLTEFGLRIELYGKQCVADLRPGLKHHSIHCISVNHDMSVVIGMKMEDFADLFARISDDLSTIYPKCPHIMGPDSENDRWGCENRFKLFMTLYRLRVGCSYNTMEKIFGWGKSSIQAWYDVIVNLLAIKLAPFGEKILENYCDKRWQFQQLLAWKFKQVQNGTMNDYINKLRLQNAKAGRDEMTMEEELFQASIGAVDGTYSIKCRVSQKVLQNNNEDIYEDRFFTDYKKVHAYKLLIVTSHGVQQKCPKLILHCSIAVGSAADGSVYDASVKPALFGSKGLITGACLLGDHAFHGQRGVICPYTTHEMQMASNTEKIIYQNFNHYHSGERMCSEHVWSVIHEKLGCC